MHNKKRLQLGYINNVKREDIEEVAKDIEVNTVYFLRDQSLWM